MPEHWMARKGGSSAITTAMPRTSHTSQVVKLFRYASQDRLLGVQAWVGPTKLSCTDATAGLFRQRNYFPRTWTTAYCGITHTTAIRFTICTSSWTYTPEFPPGQPSPLRRSERVHNLPIWITNYVLSV